MKKLTLILWLLVMLMGCGTQQSSQQASKSKQVVLEYIDLLNKFCDSNYSDTTLFDDICQPEDETTHTKITCLINDELIQQMAKVTFYSKRYIGPISFKEYLYSVKSLELQKVKIIDEMVETNVYGHTYVTAKLKFYFKNHWLVNEDITTVSKFGIVGNGIISIYYDQIEIDELRRFNQLNMPYAVFKDSVLTFYFGNKPPDAFSMRTNSTDGWHPVKEDIKTVVFDKSFTRYLPEKLCYWFDGCDDLENIIGIENLNTNDVFNMSHMFSGCERLNVIDLSRFNTENVTTMSYMFNDCESLRSLDLSGFNTENVTDMGYMFNNCKRLNNIDLSRFNTKSVTTMYSMFNNCKRLNNIDLSGFNTANVKYMSSMFRGCTRLNVIDLSGFNTAKVTSMSHMFSNCSSLTTIYASEIWNTNAVKIEYNFEGELFDNCINLVGGHGTKWQSDKKDISRAIIDGGESSPGYFTMKSSPKIK